jgi:hypothetical protein
MIEIITTGIDPLKRRYEASCWLCGTRFTFALGDTVRRDNEKTADFRYVSCPHDQCGERIERQDWKLAQLEEKE